jgi:hypothetical protein
MRSGNGSKVKVGDLQGNECLGNIGVMIGQFQKTGLWDQRFLHACMVEKQLALIHVNDLAQRPPAESSTPPLIYTAP